MSIKFTDKNYKITELNCKISEIPESLRFMLEKNVVFKAPYPSTSDGKYNKGIEILSSIFNYFKIEECDNDDTNHYVKYSFIGANFNSESYKQISFEKSDLYTNFMYEVGKKSDEFYNSYSKKWIEENDNSEVNISSEEYKEKILSYAKLFFASSFIKFYSSYVISDYLKNILNVSEIDNNSAIFIESLFKKEKKISDNDLSFIENGINKKLILNDNYRIEVREEVLNDPILNKIIMQYTNDTTSTLFYLFTTILEKEIENISTGVSINLLQPFEYDENELAKRFNRIVIKWSDIKTKSINFSSTHLKEQIRHRYHLQDRPTSGSLNTIIDSFLPSALYNCNMDSEKIRRQYSYSLSKTAYAISPYVTNLFAIKKVETKQLCRILGFDEKKIKSMLMNIKLKKLDFVFVGAGGTGINTAVWLKEMCEFSNITGLFNKASCFEEDNAELSNLLRFPIDPHSIIIDGLTPSGGAIDNSSKLHLIKHSLMQLSSNTPSLVTKFICKDANLVSDFPASVFMNNMETVVKDDGDFETLNSFRTRSNVVLYGAPDIETRINLSKAGRFISATHATNSCNVYINPIQDAMIQVESYGMIQLAPFFMNQLRMAISLLEILSDDNLDELLAEQDKSVLSYSFNGESVLKTDRIYNFNIDVNISMMTEQQAQNAGN